MRLQGAQDYGRNVSGPAHSVDRWQVRPLLIVNPRSDVRFARFVAELTADGVPDLAALQTSLRSAFPDAIVRRRELSSEPNEMWYVYRDGHWSPE